MSAIPEATRLAQARATDPKASAWVAANAGSGKTYVLAQRVLRLLLDGKDPSTLLCLTFTKAAAAEMAQRVFDTLASWTQVDDSQLREDLTLIQGRVSPKDLQRARALFARALETPGGLKIQTIHAFCESLLHQFPLEAGIAASFTVLDDREAATLMTQARADGLAEAARGADQRMAEAFEGLTARFADSSLNDHLDAFLRHRHALMRWVDDYPQHGVHQDRGELLLAAHGRLLGIDPGDGDVLQTVLSRPMKSSRTLTLARLDALVAVASDVGTERDIDRAQTLVEAWKADDPIDSTTRWNNAFLTREGKPRAVERHYFSQQVRATLPEIGEWLADEQSRVLSLRAHRAYADLLHVALPILDRFERLKAARGALDFGDLIARAARLLNRSDARDWVRYKLDQRIDHILVDEAQDTSADQWRIIRALADDFFAGQSARDAKSTPTFFAVGDEKQSIYSFQGADPERFDATRYVLETKAAQAQSVFASPVPLVLSFRSSPDILGAVDTVFAREQALDGVSSGDGLVHEARRTDRGLVELWPVIRHVRGQEPEDWTAPVDILPRADLQLAEAIAHRVARLVQAGTNAGDILILLRTRGALGDAINRELKSRAIPVAGTDRLVLTDHIAVEDLMALMQVVLLPEDDLSLACLLTSPLVGLTDQQLEQLCIDRRGTLIDALNADTSDPAIRQASHNIAAWRRDADQASPFVFLSTVLGPGGGRRKLLARLGEDARDPIDELLRLAQAEEKRPNAGLVTLEAFLQTLRRTKLEIKRDMESRADKVRIMTVHGSKGLEAKTVFLVDTCRNPQSPNGLMEIPQAGPNRPPLLLFAGDVQAAAYQAVKKDLQARQMEEYRRLLYVAMTRARDHLIVTGHLPGEGAVPQGCWYDLIDAALGPDARDVGPLPGRPDDESVRIWRAAPWPDPTDGGPVAGVQTPETLPSHRALRARLHQEFPPPHLVAPLRPSRARQDTTLTQQAWRLAQDHERHVNVVRALDDQEASLALAMGTLVHKLLEAPDLPDYDQARALALKLDLSLPEPSIEEAHKQAANVHALAVADTLFGPSARAEVTLRGTFQDHHGVTRPIAGSIDRLVVLPDEVWIIDFKTNTNPPAPDTLIDNVPDYVAQLALYGDQLAKVFPQRRIRCGLIWSKVGRLDWVAPQDVHKALDNLRKP